MEEAEERIRKLKERLPDYGACVKVGQSPTDVDGLTLNLASLDLSTLPASLRDASSLPQLASLYLDYNDLIELPNGLFFERLTKLSLIGNQLKSLPLSIGQLQNLEELYLNENDLVSLPDSILQQKHLTILNIVGNHIASLPVNIGELQLLKKLYADENELKHLPKTFGQLCSLETLELGTNRLVQLPKNFGWLKHLQVLNLNVNKLDCLPESFAELCCLTELDLSANNLRLLPPSLKAHRCLRKLYLDKNLLEELPDWMGDLPELTEFSILDNKLKGSPLPEKLGTSSSQLKVMDLGGNFISHIPDTMGELKHLERIHLGSVIDELERRNFQNGNWLWSLPQSFGHLVNLREANLDENQLESLPQNFGELINLEWLNLGQNRIYELPSSFSKLQSLRVCVLSKNHLELLPSDFGDLTKLEDLRVDNNKIAELPESFVQLTQLKSLDLFNNRLTEVPECLQSLSKLVRLDLDQNELGLDILKVPQVIRQSMYAPRDPALKDNWRGRGRQDLCNVEVTQVSISEDQEEEGTEAAEEDVQYSYSALRNAVSRNMSLWKSHDGPARREVYIHPVQPKHPQIDYSDDDSELSDTDAISVPKVNPMEEEGEEKEEENWDLELEPVPPISSYVAPAPCLSTDTLQTTCVPSHDVFVPSEQHVTSIQRQSVPNCVTEGQFDDADDDTDSGRNR